MYLNETPFTIARNTWYGNSGAGAAMYVGGSAADVNHNLIHANTGSYAITVANTSATFDSNTVANNAAGLTNSGTTLIVRNSILWGNGGIDLVAWGSTLTVVNAGVRFRAGRFYTMFSAGGMNLDRNDDIDASRAAAVHAGARFRGKFLSAIDRELLYLDADLGFVRIDNRKFFNDDGEGDQMAFQGRLMLGVGLFRHLSAFAGGGMSYLFAADGAVADGSYRPLFVAGVSLEF